MFIILKYLLIEKRVIKNSKKIFIVSNNLRLRQNKYKSKFIFIPHGVNTDYWNPENINTASIKNKYGCNKYVLCVGNHGIDKDLLYSTIKNNSKINFVVVGLSNFKCNLQNLKLLFNITDDELKCLYMQCSLFVRPMNFTTANNSILEALSMGCNILVSTPDGIYDYINRNLKSVKVVKNSKFLTEFSKFYELSNKWDEGKDIGSYAISTYDWKNIWQKTREIYEKNFQT
jgi:glycosyltransferase involved in cell wall biosynthesis